jgi:archaellum component FlaF (FlaF/FlaG flagellin family)
MSKMLVIIAILCLIGLVYYSWKQEFDNKQASWTLQVPRVDDVPMKQNPDIAKYDLYTVLQTSSSGTKLQIWENIKNNEAEILKEAEWWNRVSDKIEKYDTLIPLYFICKVTATGNDIELKWNITKYLDVVARKNEDQTYSIYTKFIKNELTMDQFYNQLILIFQDGIKQHPEFAEDANNILKVLQARAWWNYNACNYSESWILI